MKIFGIILALVVISGIAVGVANNNNEETPAPFQEKEEVVEEKSLSSGKEQEGGGTASLPKPPTPTKNTELPDEAEETHEHSEETHTHETGELTIGNATITTDGTYRYIMSNGIPNHETGTFPNSGNPNTISEQNISYRVTLNPLYTGAQTTVQVPGVGLNGVPMEPGTAEREGNLNIEALQDTYNLGLDYSNAHVQPTGLYHYHGVPEGYLSTVETDEDFVHVGWAADGFPMYVSHAGTYKPSWQLKSGTRSESVGGTYDGTYTQDFEFISGSGDLDECNGMFLNGNYVYVLTEEFPYISRCLNGTPDESFTKGGGGPGPPQGSGEGEEAGQPPEQGGGTPPQAAINACISRAIGSSCYFDTPHGTLHGDCEQVSGSLACVPEEGPPPM